MQKSQILLTLGHHSLATKHGHFDVSGFAFGDNQQILLAFSTPSFDARRPHLLRIQYGCEYGGIFGSLDCDCGFQIDASLRLIAASANGTMMYFRDHEARGFGLAAKIRMTELEKANQWSVREVEQALGLSKRRPDVLWVVPAALQSLGITASIALLGQNEDKRERLAGLGVDITAVLPLKIDTATLTDFAMLDINGLVEREKS